MDNILRSTFPGPKILCKQYAMILNINIDFYVIFYWKKKYQKPKFTIYQAIANTTCVRHKVNWFRGLPWVVMFKDLPCTWTTWTYFRTTTCLKAIVQQKIGHYYYQHLNQSQNSSGIPTTFLYYNKLKLEVEGWNFRYTGYMVDCCTKACS